MSLTGRSRNSGATARPDPRTVLAYHEAGHAVAGYWLGQELDEVSIVGNEYVSGYVTHFGRGPDWLGEESADSYDENEQRAIAAEIIIYYAGPLAEEAIGVPAKNYAYRQAWTEAFPNNDFGMACRLVELLLDTPEERDAYLKKLRNNTARLMNRLGYWPAVEMLAEVLLEARTLTGEEAESIIETALDAAIQGRSVEIEREARATSFATFGIGIDVTGYGHYRRAESHGVPPRDPPRVPVRILPTVNLYPAWTWFFGPRPRKGLVRATACAPSTAKPATA